MEARDLFSSSSLPFSYAPLPADVNDGGSDASRPRRASSVLAAVGFLLAVAALVVVVGPLARSGSLEKPSEISPAMTRGKAEGVSEKTSGAGIYLTGDAASAGGPGVFPWSNAMLQWQRTGFHFQPEKNWMNDPNGPVYYQGWYHLFYQYNPDSAVWGNISWGHAVSRDLVQWLHLPIAMVPDRWYDANGVWTGSATVLPDGRLTMLYTGSTNASVQVQNLAFPADPSDPLLRHWVKSESNPVLLPPPGVGLQDFRDPTTAWYDPSDSTWRIAIGSKDESHAGTVMVYRTRDFVSYELVPGLLHKVAGTGMWECVDFYPVATKGAAAENGIDLGNETKIEEVRHVLKASMDDDRHDYYAIGRYDAVRNTWQPDDAEMDVGLGLRYDWGKFYASKTFYDPEKKRRILWSWIGETDSERADVQKGWASLQGIPRTVLFDTKTKSNLLQWPVEELESLRMSSTVFDGITIDTGSIVPLNVRKGAQLDIIAEFQVEKEAIEATVEADVSYNCSTSGGAAGRGALGPFGLLVLADKNHLEQTAVYFYVSKGTDGGLRTHFCQDELRSSSANDIVKRVVGSTVPVLDGETFSVRILVDHSIVESFAQQGRSCITSRVYPTEAIYSAAGVYLFNNATSAKVTAKSLTIWEMSSSSNHAYPTQS
ncbi:beta-fructofuranosidase 1-like isoform X1 [Typha latifolia]|uniref:beta-fructofuranosidase 1-like isoform X1 n=1 Tax=Typha latifolia TaxID=4733 RepID=UPI003C30DBCF